MDLVSSCPHCEKPYESASVRLLGHDGDAELVHATCIVCGNAFLTMALQGRVGAASLGIATDLSPEDVLRFRTRNPVSIDDVIETHAFVDGKRLQKLVRPAKAAKSRARVQASRT